MTTFDTIYDSFLSKVTDDMYMELTEEQTKAMLKSLFINSLPHFEFPRFDLHDYNLELEEYNIDLENEEVNIISTYMVVEWLSDQVASVENTRMKYSGSDFKFTSQANHLHKLIQLKKEYERLGFHLQRLYKRRKKDDKGNALDGNVRVENGVAYFDGSAGLLADSEENDISEALK